MSGPNVPLTVRIGDKHVTAKVSDISFRREAVGGVRNITLNLLRDIGTLDADLAPFTKVYIYDGRTAATVAEGRLSDSGRSADASGRAWDIVAFGPAQHATDTVGPLIYVDRRLGDDAWEYVDVVDPAQSSFSAGTRPNDTSPSAAQGLLAAWAEGHSLDTASRITRRYTPMWQAGHKIAKIAFTWFSGSTNATLRAQARTSLDGTAVGELAYDAGWSTVGGAGSPVVVTNFPNGRNVVDLRAYWNGAVAAVGLDAFLWFDAISVRAMLVDKAGVDITTGYTNDYILAHEVVNDLLGRSLTEYDGVNAVVATNVNPIDQMAYPDGISAAQVLEDLMAVEAGHRWYTTPDTTGNGYGFRWEAWPTTVRYEITLDDGGSFPLSGQTVYNRAAVKWTPSGVGAPRWVLRTLACPLLDSQGLTRTAIVNLGSEIGSAALAATAGDEFLSQHNVPTNSGTIKVARPIRDLISGRMVEPWEIEAGELIRVRGVESYASSLNASDNDGQTVFRIWSMDYTSADNSANLALDADPADLTSALVSLLNQRTRG